MGTRLKSNKKALYTAVVIVALAAVCFAVTAIYCRYDVSEYYAEYESDFESDFFIEVLFQWNYVLYPEVMEKGGQSASIEELYLSFEEEEISHVTKEDYYGIEIAYVGNSEQLKAEYVSALHAHLLQTDELYTTELGKKLDYCVIAGDTDTVLKNTTRDIEQLTDGNAQEYVYYLIIQYDQNGNISDIQVNSGNSEQFLKNAQLVANSTNSQPLEGKQRVTNYVLINESDMVNTKVAVKQKNPQNAVFIYAMTDEQMENFGWFPIYRYDDSGKASVSHYMGSNNKEAIYYGKVGVGRWYLLCLVVITVVFGFLSRYMPQCMAETAGTRRSAELILVIQWFLAVVFCDYVILFVYYVNELYSISEQIDFVILFVVMFLLFGVWYWCLLSIQDLFRGLRSFIKNRSRLYRYWGRIKNFIHNIRVRWNDSLASVDLRKDTARFLKKMVILQCLIISIACCFLSLGSIFMICYSVALYFVLRRYIGRIQKGYRHLLQATNAIAQGKFDNAFEGDFGIFESYKEELYQIQGGFRTAVEEEVKSQRMKTELITNVSHDLKTPLTAIITYTDLLKDEKITDEQRQSYLATLERKALRLKVLIEDLFEISKASSGNVRLEPVAVDICNLIRQVYLEHEDRMVESGLEIRFDMPQEKIILQLDSQKTYRIFENLYVNITKYALPNTRVYVQAKVIATEAESMSAKKIRIELKNISAQELIVDSTDLTERFVRGDASRNSEGSGLGLAIAKSFIELQGGQFGIEIDGDLFKAVIEWKIASDL